MDANQRKEVKDEPVQSGKKILFGSLAFIVGTVVLMFLLKALLG
jgi:hypothetical protein